MNPNQRRGLQGARDRARRRKPRDCEECGSEYTPGGPSARYCESCGTAKADAAKLLRRQGERERKVTAIVSAFDDIQGQISREQESRQQTQRRTLEAPSPILPGCHIYELLRERRDILTRLRKYDVAPDVGDQLGDAL